MKYAKIVNGIVEQVQPYIEKDFIEVPDNTIAGMVDNLDGTFSIMPKTLAELKTAKISELYGAYNKANEADIAYMKTTFQADSKSQNLIAQNLSIGTVPTGFFWKDKANNKVAMTYAELQGLGLAIQDRGLINFNKLDGLKAQVKAAKTQTALNKIIWS